MWAPGCDLTQGPTAVRDNQSVHRKVAPGSDPTRCVPGDAPWQPPPLLTSDYDPASAPLT